MTDGVQKSNMAKIKKRAVKPDKKEKADICLSRGQIKTVIDQARGEDVCDAAEEFIAGIDEEYTETKDKAFRAKIKKKWDDWM